MKHLLIILLHLSILNATSIQTIVTDVLEHDPSITQRLKSYNAAQKDVSITKANFYPRVDISLGVGHDLTTKSGLAGTLHDIETSLSVYQSSLKVTQNIFNGFATSYQLSQQKYKLLSAAYSYIEKVNAITSDSVEKYIALLRNKELFENTNANVKINSDILLRVTKLYDSGLTTLSEVNKIKSSLALAQSNNVVQENVYQNALLEVEVLLAHKLDTTSLVSPDMNITLPSSIEEAITFALSNNPSLIISNYNVKMAQAAYKEKQSFLYPTLDIELSKSINQNQSATEGTINTTSAMIYLKYNLFNGFTDRATQQKTLSQLHQEVASVNISRDNIIKELSLSFKTNEKITQQLNYLNKYLGFSIQTLNLYSKEYDLGKRSLLDLLSSQNDFIGAKSQIINAKYNIISARYKILHNMGTLVASLTQNQEGIYARVHLVDDTPIVKDTLPISLDQDNDLIVDSIDICRNSIASTIKNSYGCNADLSDENISVLERFNGFIFEQEDTSLSKDVMLRMKSLIHQLQSYGYKNLRFEVYGNANYKDLSDKESQELSRQRANIFRDMLVLDGCDIHNITIHADGNKRPIVIGDETLNNRIDIIVKKLKKER